MEYIPPLRVDPASTSRVDTIPTLRVDNTPTTCIDQTAPEAICTTPRIHQRQTRNNAPLPSMQNQEPATHNPTPAPKTNVPTPTTDIPTIPRAPKRITNSKNGRHRGRVKEQNNIAKIIDEQPKEDKQQGIHLLLPPSDYHARSKRRAAISPQRNTGGLGR